MLQHVTTAEHRFKTRMKSSHWFSLCPSLISNNHDLRSYCWHRLENCTIWNFTNCHHTSTFFHTVLTRITSLRCKAVGSSWFVSPRLVLCSIDLRTVWTVDPVEPVDRGFPRFWVPVVDPSLTRMINIIGQWMYHDLPVKSCKSSG